MISIIKIYTHYLNYKQSEKMLGLGEMFDDGEEFVTNNGGSGAVYTSSYKSN